MTGFGISRRATSAGSVELSLRAVNARGLKLTVKLPEIWAQLGPDVEKRIKAVVHRGTVDCMVRARVANGATGIEINADLLKTYRRRIRKAAREAGIEGEPGIAAYLELPGVVVTTDEGLEAGKWRKTILGMLDEALEGLTAMRAKEGATIERALKDSLKGLVRGLAKVEKRLPRALEAANLRLRERVAELLKDISARSDSETLVREVAFQVERSDVSEELARLSSHAKQFRELLDSRDPVGRKLEFLAQELHREANTAGSKVGDIDLAKVLLEMRAEVDRIREQVLNVE